MSTQFLPGDGTISQVSPLPLTWEDATNFMIRRANELVDELIKQRGREEPPFLAEELAPLQGIKEIERKIDLGEVDALLIRRQDGYIINVNANSPPTRQNYSCAHEIGHTFLHELERVPRFNNEELRWDESRVIGNSKERLCQIAAAELLMPHHIFNRYLEYFGVSVSSIARLAEKFKVSIHATAIRIAEVSPEPCIAIKWKPWQKTRSKGFIAKHMGKPIYTRDPSALLKAYQTDSAIKSFKSFEIGGIRKRCAMESKGFGHDKKRHVISLVFSDR